MGAVPVEGTSSENSYDKEAHLFLLTTSNSPKIPEDECVAPAAVSWQPAPGRLLPPPAPREQEPPAAAPCPLQAAPARVPVAVRGARLAQQHHRCILRGREDGGRRPPTSTSSRVRRPSGSGQPGVRHVRSPGFLLPIPIPRSTRPGFTARFPC